MSNINETIIQQEQIQQNQQQAEHNVVQAVEQQINETQQNVTNQQEQQVQNQNEQQNGIVANTEVEEELEEHDAVGDVLQVNENATQKNALDNNGLYNKLQRAKYFWFHNRSIFSEYNIKNIENIIQNKIDEKTKEYEEQNNDIHFNSSEEAIQTVFDDILKDKEITFSNIKMLVFGAEKNYKKFNDFKNNNKNGDGDKAKIFTKILLEKAENAGETRDNIYAIVDEKFKSQRNNEIFGNWLTHTKLYKTAQKAIKWLTNNKFAKFVAKTANKFAEKVQKTIGVKIEEKIAQYKEEKEIKDGMKLLNREDYFESDKKQINSNIGSYFFEESNKMYKYYKDVNDYANSFKKDEQLTKQDKENGILNVEMKKNDIWNEATINFARKCTVCDQYIEMANKLADLEKKLREKKVADRTKVEENIEKAEKIIEANGENVKKTIEENIENANKIINDDSKSKEEVSAAKNDLAQYEANLAKSEAESNKANNDLIKYKEEFVKCEKEIMKHASNIGEYGMIMEKMSTLRNRSQTIGEDICRNKIGNKTFKGIVESTSINELNIEERRALANLNKCYNELAKQLDTAQVKEETNQIQ